MFHRANRPIGPIPNHPEQIFQWCKRGTNVEARQGTRQVVRGRSRRGRGIGNCFEARRGKARVARDGARQGVRSSMQDKARQEPQDDDDWQSKLLRLWILALLAGLVLGSNLIQMKLRRGQRPNLQLYFKLRVVILMYENASYIAWHFKLQRPDTQLIKRIEL